VIHFFLPLIDGHKPLKVTLIEPTALFLGDPSAQWRADAIRLQKKSDLFISCPCG
jgi:hypothetical protein